MLPGVAHCCTSACSVAACSFYKCILACVPIHVCKRQKPKVCEVCVCVYIPVSKARGGGCGAARNLETSSLLLRGRQGSTTNEGVTEGGARRKVKVEGRAGSREDKRDVRLEGSREFTAALGSCMGRLSATKVPQDRDGSSVSRTFSTTEETSAPSSHCRSKDARFHAGLPEVHKIHNAGPHALGRGFAKAEKGLQQASIVGCWVETLPLRGDRPPKGRPAALPHGASRAALPQLG